MATNMKDNAKRAQLKKENKELELAAYEDGFGRFSTTVTGSTYAGNAFSKVFSIAFNSKFFLSVGLFCGFASVAVKLFGSLFGGGSSSSKPTDYTAALNSILQGVAQVNATVNQVCTSDL